MGCSASKMEGDSLLMETELGPPQKHIPFWYPDFSGSRWFVWEICKYKIICKDIWINIYIWIFQDLNLLVDTYMYIYIHLYIYSHIYNLYIYIFRHMYICIYSMFIYITNMYEKETSPFLAFVPVFVGELLVWQDCPNPNRNSSNYWWLNITTLRKNVWISVNMSPTYLEQIKSDIQLHC